MSMLTKQKSEYFPIVLNFTENFDIYDNDKLFEFCSQNKMLRIERSAEGGMMVMIPIGGEGGFNEFTLAGLFFSWSKQHKELGKFFGAGTGFLLQDGSMRSPDLAFVSMEKWNSLHPDNKKKFLPLCPDFLVELRSETDRLSVLQDKMQIWIDNGCTLAWLIDPIEEKAYVYRQNAKVDRVEFFSEKLSGETVLPGFELELSEFKDI